MALAHHDLCFGCGQTNLFGLLLEVERVDERRVAGRCFIKQDHQGPDRRFAHQGVIAAALCEAMALACGPRARAVALKATRWRPRPPQLPRGGQSRSRGARSSSITAFSRRRGPGTPGLGSWTSRKHCT